MAWWGGGTERGAGGEPSDSPRPSRSQAVLAAACKADALGPMDENMGDEDDEEADGEADDLADVLAKATL